MGGGQQRPDRPRVSNAITPITVRQLLEARPDSQGSTQAIIDGKQVSHVTLVGYVIDANTENTSQTLTFDDSTAFTYARLVIDEDPTEPIDLANTYVRLQGSIRMDAGGKSSLIANRATPVTDYNEVTYHLLEALLTHLRNVQGPRGPLSGGAPGATGVGAGAAAGTSYSSHASYTTPGAQLSAGGGFASGLGASAGSAAAASAGGGLSDQVVLARIAELQVAHSGGVPKSEILKALAGEAPHEVARTLERLSDEGHIFTTFDESHFLCTSA